MTDLSDDAEADATPPNVKGAANAERHIKLASGIASTSIWRAKAVPRLHETGAVKANRNVFSRTNLSPLNQSETVKASELESADRETFLHGSKPKRLDEAASDIATNVDALVQRGVSLNKLQGVIRELHHLHDFLHNEGDRLEREISKYAQLSKTAATSTRLITENILEFPTIQDVAAAPVALEYADRGLEETPAPVPSDENSARVRLSLNWARARPIK
jgi:hypothetical protein